MTNLVSLETDLLDLAGKLIRNSTIETEVDVFKAVSTWHIAMRKATKGETDDDTESFTAMKRKLRSVT